MKSVAIGVLVVVLAIAGLFLVVKMKEVDSLQSEVVRLQLRLESLTSAQQKLPEVKERRFQWVAKWLEYGIRHDSRGYMNALVKSDYKSQAMTAKFKTPDGDWLELDLVFVFDGDLWTPNWEKCYVNNPRLYGEPLKLRDLVYMDQVRGWLEACEQKNQN